MKNMAIGSAAKKAKASVTNLSRVASSALSLMLTLILAVSLLNLTACRKTQAPDIPEPPEPPNAPTQRAFDFTAENYPLVDGSTATIPLIGAVESLLLDKPRAEVEVSVSKTSGAYIALANNQADVLLVYDGGDETRRQLNADEQFETVPIGKDALVFLVNRDNPIDNLSTEQVQKIFTGEYTNWQEVGGNNEPIRAYQRGEGSGSQAMMDKLVMRGLPMGDPATMLVIASMGGLVDAVADFSGGPTGIGYNVYYYVTEMHRNTSIKILSIDGIQPTYETIQSGQYPHVSDFYSVIRKSEPADSPARALHEWMLSDEAQDLIASEHYVALYVNRPSPEIKEHSKGYPYGEAPSFRETVYDNDLSPRNDYGRLYFYLGSVGESHESHTSRLYGLCTEEGIVLTYPVYTVPLLLTDSYGHQAYFCYRTDKNPIVMPVQTEGQTYLQKFYPAMLFATDGSWFRQFDSAMPFEGVTGPINEIRNSDILAVMRGGKWGAVNLMGDIVIPYERDDYRTIYSRADERIGFMPVAANRFMRAIGDDKDGNQIWDLCNADSELIATGLRGYPRGMSGLYIVTVERQERSITVNTYTLNGAFIIGGTWIADKTGDAEAFGDYIKVIADNRTLICDREMNILGSFENDYNSEYDFYYNNYKAGPNVIYRSDSKNSIHRTYLPDGTRLVTWMDTSSGD